MIHLIILTCLLFLSIVGYLTYFQVFLAANVYQNAYNRRLWQREENTIRGNIYERTGVLLAETQVKEETMLRRYPHNQLYSHLVGYSHRQYGRSGIEAFFNQELMALTSDNVVAKLRDRIVGERIKGNHIYLSLHHEIQKTAEELLRGKTGAIVAIDPKTGEILAMVSKPDFNPNRLETDWGKLIEDVRSPLLNRATSGLYPPGSTFKVIMAAAVLEYGQVDPQYSCTGSITIDGFVLSDFNQKGHGALDLNSSLVVSCNTNFARMAVEMGSDRVSNATRGFYFGRGLQGDIPMQTSRFPYTGPLKATELAAVAIGQGRLLATPLHMAMVAGVFANEGVMMTPRVVREVRSWDGRLIRGLSPEGNRIISPEIANEVKLMMEAAVREGTGRNARISNVRVAGKTGTAQNATGESHAWFIGFAPVENPQIAVAVILEAEGRTGGAAAAPIAREVIRRALRKGVLN